MLGLLWSLAYSLVDRLFPDSFVFPAGPASGHSMQGFQSPYFSFIMLTSTGYGDIVPVSKVARMLAIVEAVFGMFYVSLFIAQLVSLFTSNPAGDKEGATWPARTDITTKVAANSKEVSFWIAQFNPTLHSTPSRNADCAAVQHSLENTVRPPFLRSWVGNPTAADRTLTSSSRGPFLRPEMRSRLSFWLCHFICN